MSMARHFGALAVAAWMVAALLAGGASSQLKLPEAAAKSLKNFFPRATVERVILDDKKLEAAVLEFYSVAMKTSDSDFTVHLTSSGTVLEVETPVGERNLPGAVSKAVKTAVPSGRIIGVSRIETRTRTEFARTWIYHPLDKPTISFGVDMVKPLRRGSLTIAEDGTIIAAPKWTELTRASAPDFPGRPAIRVHCGSLRPWIDFSDVLWHSDQKYFRDDKWGHVLQGKLEARKDASFPTSDAPEIYRSGCVGPATYRFNLPDGKYTVRLHFCELSEEANKPGKRVFSVKINGSEVLKDLDLTREAGYLKPCVKQMENITPHDARIVIEFMDTGKGQPLCNAIEVIGQKE